LGHPLVHAVQQGTLLHPPGKGAGSGQSLAKLPGSRGAAVRHRFKGKVSRPHRRTVKVGLNRHLGPQGCPRRTGRAYPRSSSAHRGDASNRSI
jgi:hypothetical protein